MGYKYNGEQCLDCENPAKTKDRCSRCYGYMSRLGFVPKCMGCGTVTTKGFKRGEDKIYKCADCQAKADESMQALMAALGP